MAIQWIWEDFRSVYGTIDCDAQVRNGSSPNDVMLNMFLKIMLLVP